MFEKLGRLAVSSPKAILFTWIVLFLLSLWFGPQLNNHLSGETLASPNSESIMANNQIKTNFDGNYSQNIIVVLENPNKNTSDPEFINELKKVEQQIKQNKRVEKTTSILNSADPNLVDKKNNRMFINIYMNASSKEAEEYVRTLKTDLSNENSIKKGVKIHITGGAAILNDMNEVSKKNVQMVEMIGLPIVFILLLFVFRSLIASFLPILIGVFSIMITMSIIFFISLQFNLSMFLTNIVTMLGLGVSIDYALFITQRFREELQTTNDIKEAVIHSMKSAGRSVFFAGLTVMVSLASLISTNTTFFTSISLGGLIVLFVSILSAMTLLPALLVLLGHRVNSFKIPAVIKSNKINRFWHSIIQLILKKPILLIGTFLLILIAVSFPALKLQMHLPVAAFEELPEDSDSRIGMEALSDHLGSGKIFPIKILLTNKTNSILDTKSLNQINELTNEIENHENVKEVLSLESLINKTQGNMISLESDNLPLEIQQQVQSFLSRDKQQTILYVIPKDGPSSEKTRDLVKQIRSIIDHNLEKPFTAKVTGETATGLDFDQQIIKSIPSIISIIVIMTLIVLFFAFRSIILPIKAVLLNGLVTLSTLGILVYMYQLGNWVNTNAQALNVGTPVLLFAILFGLSIDYEVIIVSRIKEEYEKTHNNRSSIINGVISTMGMINGAASIMIVVFGVFIFADFRFVQEIGVGLAIAIFIDALIVRTIIVPASMHLLGNLNWWVPFNRSRKISSDIKQKREM
ncbi:MMPL family transporter [Rummeliibacillus sp. NPDC094406]|uniref:MMPL family transporter n=1 Tax=Rummeliibacillus sp. NPDC094406 TaxID=3364511 RepID=UPI00381ED51A